MQDHKNLCWRITCYFKTLVKMMNSETSSYSFHKNNFGTKSILTFTVCTTINNALNQISVFIISHIVFLKLSLPIVMSFSVTDDRFLNDNEDDNKKEDELDESEGIIIFKKIVIRNNNHVFYHQTHLPMQSKLSYYVSLSNIINFMYYHFKTIELTLHPLLSQLIIFYIGNCHNICQFSLIIMI